MWPESYYCLSTQKLRFSQRYGYLSPDFALKPADLKNITVITKEKSLPKYSQKGWGQWRPRVIAITALEQYSWGSILRTCNLSCLSVSLYLLFDISALFCPLWAAHSCLAVIWPDDVIVPSQLWLPPPCGKNSKLSAGPFTRPLRASLSLSLSLFWVRQPGLFTAWWIPYREPPLFLKWIQPSPLYRCLQIARILLPHHFLFVLYSCVSCLSAWMALFDEHTQNRCFGLRMDTLMCFCSVIRISRH